MKFKHIRDAIRGKDRQIEELTEALEHCLLACEVATQRSCECPDDCIQDLYEALDIIENKCKQVLDKA